MYGANDVRVGVTHGNAHVHGEQIDVALAMLVPEVLSFAAAEDERPVALGSRSEQEQDLELLGALAEKVDQILAWLDLPAEERPRLILSWWHGADAAGHLLPARIASRTLGLQRLAGQAERREAIGIGRLEGQLDVGFLRIFFLLLAITT